MRPGYLYFTTFAWLVFTGGRFTAPFLQEVAGFDDALIGIAIASQMLIGSLLGSIGAVVSDRLEFKFPNRGRIYCLASGILSGTVAFELHWVVQFMFRGEKNNPARILHFLARMLYSISSSIIFPILDGITLSYLKSNVDGDGDGGGDKKSAYGKERLFGAVSWAICSIIVGPALDSVGFGIFFCAAPFGALLCILSHARYISDLSSGYVSSSSRDGDGDEDKVATEMVEIENSEEQTENEVDDFGNVDSVPDGLNETKAKSGRSIDLIKSMIGSYTGFGFLLCAFCLNMGTSVVENLIFLFFESLGGTNSPFTICGLSVLVTVLFEIPIFHYSPILLAYFGAEILQIIACLAYVTRVVGYTYVPQDHMAFVLFFEPLHGVTYGCSKLSSVEFAAKITPRGYEASGQGILSLLIGIGSVVGLSLGGWIEEVHGPVTLYRSYAGIVGFGLLSFYLAIIIDKKSSYQKVNWKQSDISGATNEVV